MTLSCEREFKAGLHDSHMLITYCSKQRETFFFFRRKCRRVLLTGRHFAFSLTRFCRLILWQKMPGKLCNNNKACSQLIIWWSIPHETRVLSSELLYHLRGVALICWSPLQYGLRMSTVFHLWYVARQAESGCSF